MSPDERHDDAPIATTEEHVPAPGPTPEQRAALTDLYLFRRGRSPGQRFGSIGKRFVK